MDLLAHTADIYNTNNECNSIKEYTEGYPLGVPPTSSRGSHNGNIFKTAYWTGDGSSIVTVNEDHAIRLFIVPPDLIDNTEVNLLKPYTRRFNPSPILSSGAYPNFSLQDPATCGVIISSRDTPVKLYNALSSSTQAEASFPIFNFNTESYLPAYSMEFSDSNTLLCGSDKLAAVFDLNRPGEQPFMSLKQPGKCSTITTTSDGLIAVGTFEGSCRLYDGRSAELVSEKKQNSGKAIMQLISTDRNLLLQVNRRSTEIKVSDYRMDLDTIAHLTGLRGNTNQRIQVSRGFNDRLYAGGTDGKIVHWKDIMLGFDREAEEVLAAHENTVSSVSWNPLNMGIMATSSGERLSSDSEKTIDCSLKIWKEKN